MATACGSKGRGCDPFLDSNLIEKIDSSQNAQESFPSELVEQLRLAVASLKPKYRDVVVLANFEGLAYREVADILQIPIGTVSSRMNKALILLSKKIKRGR